MKEIKAIIQPFLLDRVLDSLHDIKDQPGVTVSEARAVSMKCGDYEQVVKIRLEIMVADTMVSPVVQAIQENAHTGNVGDGGIFAVPVDQIINIRTGDKE